MKVLKWYLGCTLLLVVVTYIPTVTAGSSEKLVLAYATGAINWPLFIAKEAGYYQKYGLDVELVQSPNATGAAMLLSGSAHVVHYSLDHIMQVASQEPSFVLFGSSMNRGMFVLMARKDIKTVAQLKGQRIGVGQIGDASYNYSRIVLGKEGLSLRDVTWVPFGPDPGSRVVGLMSGRVDATLVTAPAYFKVQGPEYRILVDFANRTDVFAASVLATTQAILALYPEAPMQLVRAHTEATKRFYDDRQFAIRAFMQHDRFLRSEDADRLYNLYAASGAFEKIPYVFTSAINSIIEQQADPRIAARMKSFDFRNVVDNNIVVRLVKERFFQSVFGVGVQLEEQQKHLAAFGFATK